jgi:hypothetical protein
MSLPPDAKLQKLLVSSDDLSKASLATRIFISRLRIEVGADAGALATKVGELKAFIQQNDYAAADLANL